MNAETLLTRGTACAAFLLYVAALALRATRLAASRNCWTAGCLAFLLHVFCAFQFVHHWSHAAAYELTARQTLETTGVNSGAGLFLNYGFAVVWALDAGWWWLAQESHRGRARLIERLIHGFMAFMWFNATVVFGHGIVRGLGVGATVLLWQVWAWKLRERRQ